MAAAPGDVRPARRQAPSAAVDAHGVIVAWGRGAQELLGYAPADVVGERAATLLAQPLPAAARRCAARREAWDGEIAVRHRDGRRLRVRLLAHPLLDAAGEARWFLTGPAPEVSAAAGPADGRDVGDDMKRRWGGVRPHREPRPPR
ncbi:PAS domain-containing protein [Streptomyces sp. 15-116A]|uniref:PAS domain-containing protein n=1 Tax=Streptomyces sp. 15-116A TaxID=2259035 RepID=UPI0021B4545F|nr:PAS domain-containing protein [Streptomyces sp. 15-116A]MCT7354137.1 PAS domain-containing protein [Streptomyces sp. 15-116A]